MLDESSIAERSLKRNFARSAVGTRAKQIVWGPGGKRYSLLPAIFSGGVLAMTCQEGSIKRKDFEFFLEHQLVSKPLGLPIATHLCLGSWPQCFLATPYEPLSISELGSDHGQLLNSPWWSGSGAGRSQRCPTPLPASLLSGLQPD